MPNETVKGFNINGTVVKYDYNSLENKLELDNTLSIANAAADAKVTGDKIGEIANAFDVLAIDDYSPKTAVFEDVKSDATKNTGKYMSCGQTTVSEGTSGLWNYYSLDVSAGEIYRVKTYQSDSLKALVYINDSNVIIARFPATKDTSLKQYTFTEKVPSGATKLVVNERVGTGYAAANIGKFVNYNFAHTADYLAWKAQQDEVRDSEILVNVPSFDMSENTGHYLDSSANIQDSSLWRIVSMDVVAGEKYQVKAQFYGSIKGVFFFDENNAFISPFYGSSNDDELHTLDVTVPQGAVSMSINDKKSASFDVKKYIKPINNDYIIVNGKTIQEIVDSFGTSGNVLYGKTLVTVGDSITYGADMDSAGVDPATGDLMTYGWQIANRNSMIFYNKGVSGSTLAAGTNRNGFAEENGRYTQLPENIDYLTIWFGWNDYACISDNLETVGTIDSSDTNSFYGAWNTVLAYLIDAYPQTRIGLIVPFGANAAVRQAVRDIAQKWGLSYFDNYTGNTELYYGKEDETVLASGLLAKCRAKWQANGAHPNYDGHSRLATQIESWLRSL